MKQKPIHLVLRAPFGKLSSGKSRFWGNPDLPEGTDYPMYIDDEGDQYPYFFICQINLEELAVFAPENPLPHTGLLSFFAKIDHYLGYMAASYGIGGYISNADDVRVMYFPTIEGMDEVVLLDDEDNPTAPDEMEITFARQVEPLSEEHELFARPTHSGWGTWGEPFEDWTILLQIDSFEGKDFVLNFMDFGVLDFIISPEALKRHDFSDVRGIVLST